MMTVGWCARTPLALLFVVALFAASCGASDSQLQERIDEAVDEALASTSTTTSTLPPSEPPPSTTSTLDPCQQEASALTYGPLLMLGDALATHDQAVAEHSGADGFWSEAKEAWLAVGDGWSDARAGMEQGGPGTVVPLTVLLESARRFQMASEFRVWFLNQRPAQPDAVPLAATHPVAEALEADAESLLAAVARDLEDGGCAWVRSSVAADNAAARYQEAGYQAGYAEGWVQASVPMWDAEILFSYERAIREAGGTEPFLEAFLVGVPDGHNDQMGSERARVLMDDPEWLFGWLVGFTEQWHDKDAASSGFEPSLASSAFETGYGTGTLAGYQTSFDRDKYEQRVQLEWLFMPDEPEWLGLVVCPSSEIVMDDLMALTDRPSGFDVYTAESIAQEFVDKHLRCPPGYEE